MSVKINHIGIAVRGLDERARFWEALGLEPGGSEFVESEQVQVRFFPAGDARIELLEPSADGSAVGRHLARRGEGIHHLALSVQDLDALLARLAEADVIVLGDGARPGAEGTRVAFLHPKSCGGVLVELVESPAPSATGGTVAAGEAVLAYLRDPAEKIWGILRSLEPAGVILEGIDLGSFDEWVSQVERGEDSVVGPSVVFLPMSRIERLLLDRSSGDLPSLSERFLRRVGRSVHQVLGGG